MTQKTVRLDKWLWFARVVKTRTLAQKLIRSGKVRANKVKLTNPANPVGADDVLTITLERQIKILKIVDCGVRRGPFAQASKLYEDLSPAPIHSEREQPISEYKNHEKIPRPGKLDRRKLIELKNRQYFQ